MLRITALLVYLHFAQNVQLPPAPNTIWGDAVEGVSASAHVFLVNAPMRVGQIQANHSVIMTIQPPSRPDLKLQLVAQVLLKNNSDKSIYVLANAYQGSHVITGAFGDANKRTLETPLPPGNFLRQVRMEIPPGGSQPFVQRLSIDDISSLLKAGIKQIAFSYSISTLAGTGNQVLQPDGVVWSNVVDLPLDQLSLYFNQTK